MGSKTRMVLFITCLLVLIHLPMICSYNAVGSDPLILTDYGPRGEDLDNDIEIFAKYSETLEPNSSSIIVSGISGETKVKGDRMEFIINGTLEYGRTYHVHVYGFGENGQEAQPFQWHFTTTDKGYVHGKVLDWYGEPVENARIIIDGSVLDRTDENGRYVFRYGQGTYDYRVEKDGYLPWEGKMTITAGDNTDSGVVVMESEDDGFTLMSLVLLICLPSILVIIIAGGVAASILIRRGRKVEVEKYNPKEEMKEILRENGLDPDETNLYRLMGLEDFASSKEIKKAFSRLEGRYRIDGVSSYGEDLEEIEERFSEVLAARDLLLDRKIRNLHDSLIVKKK